MLNKANISGKAAREAILCVVLTPHRLRLPECKPGLLVHGVEPVWRAGLGEVPPGTGSQGLFYWELILPNATLIEHLLCARSRAIYYPP